MAKKSKPAESEALSGDILDLIWTHVINPDPGGAWLDEALKNSAAPEPLKTALPALGRILATNASREDLGRVARLDRYERCFGLLYELDDPGLTSGKLTGLREQLLNPPARGGKEKKFMAVLWEGIGDADDDGERWAKTSPQFQAKDEPFGEVDPAVARLLKVGVLPRDLELFARWQRFDATVELLRLFERVDITEAEELLGLHESILGAEPSGKEARPGSWPVPPSAPASPKGSGDPTKSFLELKRVEGFGYTPDGMGIVVGCRQVLDAETGKPRLNMEVKGQPTSGVFSEDRTRLIVTTGPNKIMVCDLTTGKLLRQTKWPGKVANLQLIPVPGTERGLIETFTPNNNGGFDERYFWFDTASLEFGDEVSFLPEKTTTRILNWSTDGRTLFAFFHVLRPGVSGTYLQAWVWPELKPLWSITLPESDTPWSMTSSPDAKVLAISSLDGGVALLNTSTGDRIASLKVDDESHHLAFAADNRHLVTGGHGGGGKIRIWDFTAQRIVRELETGTGWCFSVSFSPDGKTLGAAGHKKSMFWRFDPLIEAR